MKINVSIRKTSRNGGAWFEVSAHDQDARDAVGATMGRAGSVDAALADFSRRTIERMVSDLIVCETWNN